MPLLELEGLAKAYGDTTALRELSLAVGAGEIVALLGPSGCGKTTLLRVIAGLERADAGIVRFDGRDIAAVPTHRRNFGLMFQDLALFPHMDVAANIGFGLRMRRWPRARRDERVRELLALVGLAGFGKRTIEQLSGGERQRVALARSLAPSPRLLMLDEPMGALDRALRHSLIAELRTILNAIEMTALYVTHDQDEALAIADRVAVLSEGRLMQVAPPAALVARPASVFVARFLGYENLLPARVERRAGGLVAMTDAGALAVGEAEAWPGGDAVVLVPDDAATLRPAAGADLAANELAGEVLERAIAGRRARLRVRAGAAELMLTTPPGPHFVAGDRVRIAIDPAALRLLPPER